MTNPFKFLGQPKLENPQGELVTDSALSCQEEGCSEVVTEGRYLDEVSVLTWICSKGHMSRVEGFSL